MASAAHARGVGSAASKCTASSEVHRILGPGSLETAYEEALAIELAARGIRFKSQVAVPLLYKGTRVGHARLDFLMGAVWWSS